MNVFADSIGGTRLHEVASRVEKYDVNPERVPLVVVHLGSCDFSMGPDGSATPAKEVYAEYIEALNAISSKFHQAEIAIASIPPRYLKSQETINADGINNQIEKLNNKLHELCDQEENLIFIDNTELYWEGGKVKAGVFRDSIHLNKDGRKLLNESLIAGIRDAYYKQALRSEWDVVPTHTS